ncbi:MAG: hypothetical protein E6J90_12160 [Deltaproteobacteria bacterium]|nr:MAG: hypothetical protein E6J90_12160 [Deltaproteobacteria bacterium]
MHRTLALLAIVAACGKTDRDHATPATAPAAAPTAVLARATQADLARDIADADRLGTWREVQQRWHGQTVRWTVTHRHLLCRSADDCNVAAFPIQRPAQQGWMPALQFAPGQFDALARRCGSQDPCEVTIEGTLSQLEVSPELPTSVQLSNVRILPPPTPRTQTAQR